MQIVKDYRDNKVLSAREKLRYSQIRRDMYNITDAVLAATLKDLTESVSVIVKPKVWEEEMMNVRIADLKDFEKIMKIYK